MNKAFFALDGSERRDRYKLLSGLVVPRPIGWIGTRRPNGSYNLAPFSFFNVVSTSPPMVLFSGGRHPDRPKDSVELANQTGEFTVNIVSADLAQAMSVTSGSFGPDDDEFAIAGLTPVPGSVTDAPLVDEAPANLECRVEEMLAFGEEPTTRLVIGQVLAIHVREDALDGTRVKPEVIDAVGRMSGTSYTLTRDRFEITRSR